MAFAFRQERPTASSPDRVSMEPRYHGVCNKNPDKFLKERLANGRH